MLLSISMLQDEFQPTGTLTEEVFEEVARSDFEQDAIHSKGVKLIFYFKL